MPVTDTSSPLPLSRAEAIAELNRLIAELDQLARDRRERLWCWLVDVACRDTIRSVMSEFDGYETSLRRRVPDLAELKVRYPEAWDLSEGGKRDRENRALRAWLLAGIFEQHFGPLRPVDSGCNAAREDDSSTTSAPPNG